MPVKTCMEIVWTGTAQTCGTADNSMEVKHGIAQHTNQVEARHDTNSQEGAQHIAAYLVSMRGRAYAIAVVHSVQLAHSLSSVHCAEHFYMAQRSIAMCNTAHGLPHSICAASNCTSTQATTLGISFQLHSACRPCMTFSVVSILLW